jgi:GT2 family glycosyltransferase
LKISWVMLTYGRGETVKRSFEHNLEKAGRKHDELIWVDNGSKHEDFTTLTQTLWPHTSANIFHRENQGVAKGYNRGMSIATGDVIVITGCDRLMADQWMATLELYFNGIPHTGIISVYSQPNESVPERFKEAKPIIEEFDQLEIIQALPIGAKMFRRDLLKDIGYLREDFGMYGWEDVEWAYRAQRYCDRKGLLSYIIPGFTSEHMGSEGVEEYNGKDAKEYHEFKKREAMDPKKSEVMNWCRDNDFPYYNPY